jgi:hypothetical protein
MRCTDSCRLGALVVLTGSEVRPMADVIPLDEFERKAQREHARVVSALRDLADRLEGLPEFKIREALPIAAWGVEELSRRLRPWLR